MKFRLGLLASVGFLGVAGVSTAYAADLLPPPPPPKYVEVVDTKPSCFYARADVGGSFHQRPTVTKQAGAAFGGGSNAAVDEKIKDHVFFEGGVGCQVSDNLRVEVTGGYRMKASLSTPFNDLSADLATYTGFVNAFWDITNYNGFTPYLGGGVGVAHHRLTNVTLPATSSNGNRTDLAYNVTAGISYDITNNLLLDVAYRYVDLGFARSRGTTPMTIDDLKSHEIKVGMRYHFNSW